MLTHTHMVLNAGFWPIVQIQKFRSVRAKKTSGFKRWKENYVKNQARDGEKMKEDLSDVWAGLRIKDKRVSLDK